MDTQRKEQLEKLYNVILEIYTDRNDSHPEIAAKFHVEGFVATNKNDKWFDDLLQMEIEDCSRALKVK